METDRGKASLLTTDQHATGHLLSVNPPVPNALLKAGNGTVSTKTLDSLGICAPKAQEPGGPVRRCAPGITRGGAWAAQWVKWPTTSFGSGHDLRVVR